MSREAFVELQGDRPDLERDGARVRDDRRPYTPAPARVERARALERSEEIFSSARRAGDRADALAGGVRARSVPNAGRSLERGIISATPHQGLCKFFGQVPRRFQ